MPKYNYDEQDDAPDGEEKEGSSTVVLLPKAILMGRTCKVGDTVTLKITALRGKEVEVENYSAPEAAEEAGEEETSPPPEAESEGEGEAAPAPAEESAMPSYD